MPKRHVAAVTVGNAIEFYDFVTYAFFATQIGHAFFPVGIPGGQLLASLATFGAGFLTRPLGAFVIGRMGDRVGRKPAMLLSFGLIGIGVIGLPLTPTYAQIGLAAPVLAIVFRLVQGFALGGDVGPTTAYMLEAAPAHRRGLYISMQAMSADGAVLVAGLVGVALAHVLGPQALGAWGWRVALLLGAVIVPFGLFLRRTLVETFQVESTPQPLAPGERRAYLRVIVLGLMMIASATVANYVLDYMTTYAHATLGMPERVALGATAVVGLCGFVCDPVGGWLSDRYGRKPVMMVPFSLLVLAIVPAFHVLEQARSGPVLYLTCTLLAVLAFLSTVTILVTVTESLPARVRSGGLALIYALAVSVFGGSTQFIVAWLTRATGNPLAPAWYMVGAAVLGLLAMAWMPESAPARRHRGAASTPLPDGTGA